jgi:hypothetical protein
MEERVVTLDVAVPVVVELLAIPAESAARVQHRHRLPPVSTFGCRACELADDAVAFDRPAASLALL